MKVLKTLAGKYRCHRCKPEEADEAFRKLNMIPKRDRVKAHRELEDRFRVVAACDKPVVNKPGTYQVCGHGMCAGHIGKEPQDGIHWCHEHKGE